MSTRVLLAIVVVLASQSVLALPDIQVQGLMQGRAVLTIEGSMHILKEGDSSPEGVEVIEANSDLVVIEYQGQRHEMGLSSRAGGEYEPPQLDAVIIPAGAGGHYFVQGRLNGQLTNMLVDTGATSIVLNSSHANSLNLDYENAEMGYVSTASGVSEMRQIVLNSVAVGQITLNQIDAMVIEGDFPEEVLLGNSFLSRVNMRQDGNTMVLESKF